MSLENIYYVGQTVSVIVLIISLVFVGLQIRVSNRQTEQANTLARAQNRRELISQYGALFETGITHPEYNLPVAQCYLDFENAAPDHQAAFAHQQHKAINILEQGLYLYDEGLLDEVTLEGIENVLLMGLAMPGGRQYWARLSGGYNQRLRSHIDEILEDRGAQMPNMGDLLPFFDPARYESDHPKPEPPGEADT